MTIRRPRRPPRAVGLSLTVAVVAGLLGPALQTRAADPPVEKPPSNEELARRIDALTRELEAARLGEAAGPAAEAGSTGTFGLGPAASKVYRVKSGLSIGGYGESLYQNFDTSRQDGAAAGKTNEWDYLRAVLYLGWKFNRTFVLNTEIEYEHASTGKGGEVSVEFATLDALLGKGVNLRAGLVLVPVGLVNEMHEPTTYLGARRTDVETRILPSTWRANGLGLFGDVGPLAYKLYVVEGLNALGFTASTGIRGGRQSGARAAADNLAVAGRLDAVGVPGLLAGLSFYTGESGKDVAAGGQSVGVRTTTWDVHAEYRSRGLWLRSVVARVTNDEVALLDQALGLSGSKSVGETLEGWYVSAGYDVWGLVRPGSPSSLTPFVRYERTDTQKEVPDGFARDGANDVTTWTVGLDVKPIASLALKVDYQDVRNAARTGVSQWNVALAYLF